MAKKQQEEVWRERVSRYEQSGLSAREYCRRNSLKIHQLSYWRDRIKQLEQNNGQFVQVSGATKSVELQIGSQVKLVVSAGYDAAMVKSLVELLSDAKS